MGKCKLIFQAAVCCAAPVVRRFTHNSCNVTRFARVGESSPVDLCHGNDDDVR